MRKINEIIIHCTATRPAWREGQSAETKVHEVRQWHIDRGWSDIGYHYLIDRDGTVVAGRPIDRQGAHAKGRNKNSVGIALFGGHGGSENDQFDDNFTPEQEMALRSLIADLQSQFGELKVSGHNQFAAKACPCFRVPEWYSKKPARTSPTQSTTIRAAVGTAVAGAGGVLTALSNLDPTAQYIVLGFACVALIGLGWIARERLHRWAKGDR